MVVEVYDLWKTSADKAFQRGNKLKVSCLVLVLQVGNPGDLIYEVGMQELEIEPSDDPL